MGTKEDRQRAERARERGREERAEKEAEAQAEALRVQNRRAEHQALLEASVHPLAFLTTSDFGVGAATLGGILLLVGGVLFVTFWGAPEQIYAIGILGVTVVVSAVVLVLVNVVKGRVKAAWQVEAQWLAGLPFQVDGIDDGIATTTSGRELRVKCFFKVRNEMPLEKARAMVPHVDPGGKVERDGEQLRITARVAGEPDGDVARVKARRLLFRDLVDGVLLPLHADAPITRIVLDD